MSTLTQNASARGAARKAGTAIVNSKPLVAPKPPPTPKPIVNLATRTYSGAPPKTSVSPIAKASGVNLATRTVLPGNPFINPRRAADAMRPNAVVKPAAPRTDGTENTGYTGGFATLEDAQKAGDEYYRLNGAHDPSIEAAIFNFQNPDAAKQSMSEMQGAYDRLNEYNGMTPKNPLLTASAQNNQYLNSLREQLAGMGDDYKFDESDMYLTREERDAKLAEYNQKKADLQDAIAAETENLRSHQAPISASGDRITASRNAAVQDLVRQGITDPAQILDALNYDENGNQIGDFTPQEVQRFMGSSGGRMPTAGTGGTSKTSAKPMGITTTNAAISAMIANSPPETQGFLQTAFQVLGQRMGTIGQDFTDDKSLADAEFKQFTTIVNEMLDRQDGMFAMKQKIMDARQQEDKVLAEQQRSAGLQQNEMERQMAQLKANDDRRNLERAWAQRVEQEGNRLAVMGGYGSMNNIKKIEETQTDGAKAVADFALEVAANDSRYVANALKIENDYTSNVVQIHRMYTDELINTIDKYNDKVDEIKKLQFGASQRRYDQIRTAQSTMRKDWNDAQEKALNLLQGAANTALDERHKTEVQIRQDKKDLWNDTMTYVEKFGTKDKTFLSKREADLGLTPGTLTSNPTIEEIRLMRSGAGAGGATGAAMTWLQETVGKLKVQFPHDSPNEILIKAASLANQRFPGTSKANSNIRNSIYDTLSEETGTMMTAASVTKDIAKVNAQSMLRLRVLTSTDPEGEMNKILDELTAKKGPFAGDDEAASEFVVGLFEGTDVYGNKRPNVQPVSNFWNVGNLNPVRILPGFTSSKFSFEQ